MIWLAVHCSKCCATDRFISFNTGSTGTNADVRNRGGGGGVGQMDRCGQGEGGWPNADRCGQGASGGLKPQGDCHFYADVL
jgi:hypothetical protein